MFPDADAPWLPELIDVEAKKAGPQADYYSRFGWENIVVPDDCPIIASRMDFLKVRFDERYANRMLNAETMERWQVRLQNRFDEVVHRYERAYALYRDRDDDMRADIIRGEKVTFKGTTASGGKDTTVSGTDTHSADTPDSGINASGDYGSSVTSSKTDGSVSYGRTEVLDSTTEHTVTGGTLVDDINHAVDAWRDLDTELVREFENNFLNVWWY